MNFAPRLTYRIKQIKELCNDCLFPVRCLSCGTYDLWLCDKCLAKLTQKRWLECPFCRRDNSDGSTCHECRSTHSLNGLWIAGSYHDKVLAHAIKTMKYGFVRDIAEAMALFISAYLEENKIIEAESGQFNGWPLKQCLLIPVPSHPRRLSWRGFNQAEEIARHLSHRLGLDIEIKSLIRRKHTKPQSAKLRNERLGSLDQAFHWTGSSLNNKRVILIDDITTTGATLEACAQALNDAKPTSIWGLVIAKN